VGSLHKKIGEFAGQDVCHDLVSDPINIADLSGHFEQLD
jgi:hypothetical protein